MSTPTDLTRVELAELAQTLQEQHAAKHDIVVPASRLAYEDGLLVVRDEDVDITLDGVTSVDRHYRPGPTMDGHVAERLDIPVKYLRRMREQHVELLDQNVNGWLRRDPRSFLVRTFTDTDGGPGFGRALMSDRYRIVDHLDVLMTALAGIRESGVNVEVANASLTETRMQVRFHAPEVAELAPELLKGYRSPFTGQTGDENPTVFAGFVLSNSETGGGAFTLVPQVVVQVCTNGMTRTKDAIRAVHVGSRLDEGKIAWADDTRAVDLELIHKQSRDAIRQFLTPGWLKAQVDELTAQAGREVADPAKAIEAVSKKLRFSDDEQSLILSMFIKGGQTTAGGVAQAITAAAQMVPADRQYDLEAVAADAMALV